MIRLVVALLVLGLAACDSTGQEPATVGIEARGTDTAVLVDGAWTITLTRAELAFGPAYFCATTAASSELCETAIVETTEAHGIDALDPDAQPLGALLGLSGDVRSVQYDLGLAFLLTQSKPSALPGSIDGHSAVLEGQASDGVTTVDFVASIDVSAKVSGTSAIVGTRVAATIPPSGATLVLDVDPKPWLVGLDWAALAALPHAPGEPVVIAKDTAAYDAILRGITIGRPLRFAFALP